MLIDKKKIFLLGLLLITFLCVAAQHETLSDTIEQQVAETDSLLIEDEKNSIEHAHSAFLRDTGQIKLYTYEIDTTLLHKFRNDPVFDYEERLPTRDLWKEFIQWLGNKLRKWFPKIQNVQLENFFKIVFIIAAVILIVLIVWMILRGSFTGALGKKDDSGNVVIPSEENIRELNLDELIATHIAEENFRFAIRYMFLKVLKILDENKQIKWKSDKTNYEFGNEIKDIDTRTVFFRLAYIYDVVWYGNFSLDKEQFQNLNTQYDAFYRDEKNI